MSAWRHVQLCSGAADRISEFAPHYTMSYYTLHPKIQQGNIQNTKYIQIAIIYKFIQRPQMYTMSYNTRHFKIQEQNTKYIKHNDGKIKQSTNMQASYDENLMTNQKWFILSY